MECTLTLHELKSDVKVRRQLHDLSSVISDKNRACQTGPSCSKHR